MMTVKKRRAKFRIFDFQIQHVVIVVTFSGKKLKLHNKILIEEVIYTLGNNKFQNKLFELDSIIILLENSN